MRVIKITAIWCSACLIMNKVWDNILKKYNIETTSLDYDMNEDEVGKYNLGDILPVFIFFKDDIEVKRICGEVKEEELVKIIKELGISEKDC